LGLMKTCVKGVFLNIAHYTPVRGTRVLHGHTYEVRVCIEGLSTVGYLADFIKLREVVEGVVDSINYSLIVPKDEVDKVVFEAPNTVLKVAVVNGDATAENLAKLICRRLMKFLNELVSRGSSVSKVCVDITEPSGSLGEYCELINP